MCGDGCRLSADCPSKRGSTKVDSQGTTSGSTAHYRQGPKAASCLQALNKGSDDQAVGRSRGDLSTIWAVRGLSCRVRFILTADHRG
jgi:hypothetical protein